jgi:hypothetical protein
MPNMQDIKARMAAASKIPSKMPSHVIDLSLADSEAILPDTQYVGRIVSARLINSNPALTDRAAKIDVCIEILGNEEERIGAINDYLYLSVRSLRRLKEFLLSAGLEAEAKSKTLDAGLLCDNLPGRLVTLMTRESLRPGDRGTEITVASYMAFQSEMEVV